MKKSEIYYEAMLAVLDDDTLTAPQKFEIVERLMTDRNLAKWTEDHTEEQEDVK